MEFCKFCGAKRSKNNSLIKSEEKGNAMICFECVKKFRIISKGEH